MLQYVKIVLQEVINFESLKTGIGMKSVAVLEVIKLVTIRFAFFKRSKKIKSLFCHLTGYMTLGTVILAVSLYNTH